MDRVKVRVHTAVPFRDVASRMGSTKPISGEGGIVGVRGQAGPINVIAKDGSVVISGCPGKLFFGHNVRRVGPLEMGAFIGATSDLLGLDRSDLALGIVSELDVNANLVVSRPPPEYFSVFNGAPHFRRDDSFPSTLYYKQRSGNRLIRIYDKTKETRDKGVAIPEGVESMNLLRFEVSVKYAKHWFDDDVLDDGALTLGMLGTDAFWPLVVAHWVRHAEHVPLVVPPADLGSSPFTTKRDLTNALARIGLDAVGGLQRVGDLVDGWYQSDDINRGQRDAMKKGIRDLAALPGTDRDAFMLWAEVYAAIKEVQVFEKVDEGFRNGIAALSARRRRR